MRCSVCSVIVADTADLAGIPGLLIDDPLIKSVYSTKSECKKMCKTGFGAKYRKCNKVKKQLLEELGMAKAFRCVRNKKKICNAKCPSPCGKCKQVKNQNGKQEWQCKPKKLDRPCSHEGKYQGKCDGNFACLPLA